LVYPKKTLLLIGFATLLRCIVAGAVELGNDEVYYRGYATTLQWNYFDHPPLVGWLIRFTTANLIFDKDLFIRLGAIISSAVSTWLIFLCGKKLVNDHTGYLAACLYTASIYSSVIAGLFILPDSPQMVFWLAGLWLLISISGTGKTSSQKRNPVLLFGVVAGLGMMCKVHTAFLWLGFLLYIVGYDRQWLKNPVLYVSGLITLFFFYPVIQWNIDNHFITFLYHGERVNVLQSGFDLENFGVFAAGQFFYVNPVVMVCILLAVAAALKNQLPVLGSHVKMLLLTGLPLIIVTAGVSLFRPVLPHWTGPAYSSLILLTACYFTGRKMKFNAVARTIPLAIPAAGVFLLAVVWSGVFLINHYPGTTGNKEPDRLGEGDFTLDLYGWNELKMKFRTIAEKDLKNGTMKKDAVIVCNKWFPAAHIDHYVAEPLGMELLALGNISDIHQFAWLNRERKPLKPGDDAYYIVPSNYPVDVRAVYGIFFSTILPPLVIEQNRNGSVCRRFGIWRLKGFTGCVLPGPVLASHWKPIFLSRNR
jgi:hypothetical protein